jgi:hypothetical protein
MQKNQAINIIMPEWETIMVEALNWQKGVIINHSDVAKIGLLKEGTQKYYNTMSKVVSEATKRGVRIVCVKNQGYKRLCPDEWLEEAKKLAKRGGKYLEEAHIVLQHAPLLEMSEDNRNLCIGLSDMLIKQKYMLSGGVVQFDTIENKNKREIRGIS